MRQTRKSTPPSSRHGVPEIISSDQGCQFTSKELADACSRHSEMKVSMDGRGHAKDNTWIERFWKTVLICSLESRDLLKTTTTTVVTKESTVQYQASPISVRQHGLN